MADATVAEPLVQPAVAPPGLQGTTAVIAPPGLAHAMRIGGPVNDSQYQPFTSIGVGAFTVSPSSNADMMCRAVPQATPSLVTRHAVKRGNAPQLPPPAVLALVLVLASVLVLALVLLLVLVL